MRNNINWLKKTMRIKRNTIIYGTVLTLAAMLQVACSDDITGDYLATESEGLQFEVSTTEIGDQTIDMGGETRSTGSVMPEANMFKEHTLEGDNPYGLKVHREPLPLMGIHSTSSQTSKDETRAGANEVVEDITNFHDSLTIWGYTDNSTTLFNQILLTKIRNWRNSVEWPYGQGNFMRFYAVAPSLESVNMSVTGGSISYSTAPTLVYTLPEKVEQMRDVLYGVSDIMSISSGPAGSKTGTPQAENLGKDNKNINLKFHHILSAIRFSQGIIPTNITINSIALSGVKNKGTFDADNNDVATGTEGTWEMTNTTTTYTINTTFTGTGTENTYIDGGKVMFLIPYTLDNNARLTIKLTDTNTSKSHTLTCSLEGDVWKKGYTVNYKITIGELSEGYYMTADAEKDLEHSNTAVNSTLNVHSYHLYSDYSSGTKTESYRPVTWKVVEYSTDTVHAEVAEKTFTSARPTWLTDIHGTLSGVGEKYVGGNPAAASFTLGSQELALSASHEDVLVANLAKEGIIDLSTHYPDNTDRTDETANCYIVNRKGTYTFPLVYGNMSADNASMPACFKDHAGNTITKYRIKEQIGAKTTESVAHEATEYLWSNTRISEKNLEPTLRVVLLWQDVKGLVTSPSVLPSSDKIQFIVSQSTPGNAVLALQARKVTYAGVWASLTTTSVNTYGDWETLWTWHIWMTDEVYKNDSRYNDIYYDTYYTNGPTTNVQGDHIAQLKNSSGGNVAKILPVNLGWVPDDLNFGKYKKREVWVKLRQTTSNNETVVHITQHARPQLVTGTGTIYQWGRPTAFPAFNKVDGKKRTIYDIDGNDITNQFIPAKSTSGADAIAKPYNVLYGSTNLNAWFDVTNDDYNTGMWNSESKTVYDPCPSGFRVPPLSIFTGFSKTGATVENDGTKLNMYSEEENLNGEIMKNGQRGKGGYFFTKAVANESESHGRYDDVVYMPATGQWHGNKEVTTVPAMHDQESSIFWTSDYHDDNSYESCYLWISPEISYTGATAKKPTIGFFGTTIDNKADYYSSVNAIRPMKVE